MLACLCLLLNAALQQSQIVHICELFAVQAGKMIPDLNWWTGQTEPLHYVAAFNTSLYTGLWAIKISFMDFSPSGRRSDKSSVLVVDFAGSHPDQLDLLHCGHTVGMRRSRCLQGPVALQ